MVKQISVDLLYILYFFSLLERLPYVCQLLGKYKALVDLRGGCFVMTRDTKHLHRFIMDSSNLLKLLLKRRTTHYLGKDRELDKQVVIKILREALLVAPSFFNAQTTRMVLLLDDENEKLWELVKECLEKHSKEKSLGLDTIEKLNGFKQANGTVSYSFVSWHSIVN